MPEAGIPPDGMSGEGGRPGEGRLGKLVRAIDPGGLGRVRPGAPLWDAILGAMAITIFTVDLYTSGGATPAVLYPLLVILAAIWWGRTRILVVAAAAILLTLLGWAYERYDVAPAPAFDRLYSLLAILVAAWITLRLDNSREALRHSLDQLAHELAQRDRMERLAHESERRYRYLFRNASDIFLVVDAFSRQVVDFNRAAVEAYGYSEEELLEKQLPELVEPSSRQRQMEMFEAARAGRTAGLGELRHLRRNGAAFAVQPQLTPLRLGERELVFLMVRDLSSHPQAQGFDAGLTICPQCGAVQGEAGQPNPAGGPGTTES
ncbi:PAS domain S-box protein [bacterium]|nr:PAS domain S-box protein [bacterium]